MLSNYIEEQANAPGTAVNVNLAGAPAGRRVWRSGFATGTVVFYGMTDGTQEEWGVGTLTWGSPDVLARTTVLGNSAGTTARLNFTGAVRVYNEVPAERMVYINQTGKPNVSGDVFQTPSYGGVSSGSASAYSVTLSPAPTAYVVGMLVRFIAHVSNAAAATLNVNGLGPKTLYRKASFSGLVPVGWGDIYAGDVVEAVYDGTQFRLISGTNASHVQAGCISAWAGWYLPPGWIWCDGRNVSRTQYPDLRAILENSSWPFGAGDGSTTMGVPDLRGRTIFGLENIGGVSTTTRMANVYGNDRITLGAGVGDDRLYAHSHGISDPGHGHTGATDTQGAHQHTVSVISGSGVTPGGTSSQSGAGSSLISTSVDGSHNHNVSVSGNTTGVTVQTAGAGNHQNIPPGMMLNYIIFGGG